MNKFILILCIGISSAFSFACSPGVGGGPSGDPHCMAPILANDPYYNGSMNQQSRQPQTITVYLPSKYGAVAVNTKTGISGGALNKNSKSEAKQAAIKQCEEGGKNAPCQVVMWVRNGCIAVAEGKFSSGKSQIFYSSTGKAGTVENDVLHKCHKSGASKCEVFIPEGCSLP